MDNHDVIYMEPRCHGCSYEAKGGAGLIWCEDDVQTKCEECGEKPVKYLRATPAREAAGELLEACQGGRDELDGLEIGEGANPWREGHWAAIDKLKTVIAKAKP